MQFTSLYVPVENNHQLHLMSIQPEPNTQNEKEHHATPVLMIHGMVEDGRIFYHTSGKGLGSYLASQGYQVYIADLRGIGKSTPAINAQSLHGQSETIIQDIPALIDFVLTQSGHKKLHIIAHSWGGVYLNSSLLRYPQLIPNIISGAYFGSKRQVKAQNIERLFKINFVWNFLCRIVSKRVGYLPAVKIKIGSENETTKSHHQCVAWVNANEWIDSDDQFNYQAAACENTLPPIRYYAGENDHSLGHYSDVIRFMNESGKRNASYQLLSKAQGNKKDYGHIDMLTAPEAPHDHFPDILKYFQENETA
jgi:pimeloyl-ACP methyl ester carboxylesterase